jgi:hypothetical protein
VARYPGRVFAHVGGRYDFLFLDPKDEVLMTGATILRARLGKARLCDSYPMFLQSLAKVGAAVGVPKLEEFPRHRLKDALASGEVSLGDVDRYCLNDCRALMAGLKAHRDFCLSIEHREPRWTTTSGSTAVYCAEASDRAAVKHLRRHSIDLEDWAQHRQAVGGGRCELWQLGHVEGPLWYYDVKSSYPSRYLEGPLPVGPWREVGHEVHGLPAMYRVRFRQPKDRLPLLTADGVHCHEGEGFATSEEVSVARAELGAEVEVLWGWVSAVQLPFGRDFLKLLYALKEKGSPFAKVTINSLHGKLGEKVLGGMYWLNEEGKHQFIEELRAPRWWQRPLMEACVLSRARIALWRAGDGLLRDGHRLYYTDTDCLQTSCPPSRFEAATGAQLGPEAGQWELKGQVKRALYVAPKAYALWWEDGSTSIACKGFPPEQVNVDTLCAAWERPVNVKALFGLRGFRSGGAHRAEVRTFDRTLAAHPGSGKVRLKGDRVWYRH